jgi:hypothetical protein
LPVYEVEYNGHRFGMYKARLGAPACVGCFEDIIPMGVKRILLLGNCGVVDRSIKDCSFRYIKTNKFETKYSTVENSLEYILYRKG